jgi:hypothetical protein
VQLARQSAIIDINLDPFHQAVSKRDARLAADATSFHFKLATANLLPAGRSDTSRGRQGEENG